MQASRSSTLGGSTWLNTTVFHTRRDRGDNITGDVGRRDVEEATKGSEGSAIEEYDIFLCHTKKSASWEAEVFASDLYEILTSCDRQYKVFFDKKSLMGKDIEGCVQAAGRTKVLMAICDDSFPFDYCCNEIASALNASVPVQTLFALDKFTWDQVGKPAWIKKDFLAGKIKREEEFFTNIFPNGPRKFVDGVFSLPIIEFHRGVQFKEASKKQLLDAIASLMEEGGEPQMATEDPLRKWIDEAGLSEFAQPLKKSGIDTVDMLLSLEDVDLKEIGFKIGHVKKLRAAQQKEAKADAEAKTKAEAEATADAEAKKKAEAKAKSEETKTAKELTQEQALRAVQALGPRECSEEKIVFDSTMSLDKVKSLVELLPSLRNLKALYLRQCRIGDAGAEALAGALPSMRALRELNLWDNSVGDAGAEALAQALPAAPGLKSLVLAGNNNIGAGAQAALRTAWGGREGNLYF